MDAKVVNAFARELRRLRRDAIDVRERLDEFAERLSSAANDETEAKAKSKPKPRDKGPLDFLDEDDE